VFDRYYRELLGFLSRFVGDGAPRNFMLTLRARY
jgi:hypothetical protein